MGERRVTVKKPAQLPIQMIAYHVPEATHPDAKVLDLVATVLSTGQSSRLYKRMVDEEPLALSVNGGSGDSFDPTLMTFTIQPRSGVDLARTEKALYQELERLQTAGGSRPRTAESQEPDAGRSYRQLKTIAGRASLLGHYEVVLGDYRKLFSVDQAVGSHHGGRHSARSEEIFRREKSHRSHVDSRVHSPDPSKEGK